MKIARVDIAAFEPEFADGDYVMSYVTQTGLRARVLRITTDTGAIGYGEIVRRPDRDHDAAKRLEDELLPTLTGLNLSHLPNLCAEWRDGDVLLRGLAFGIETAFFDITARAVGAPMSALIGPTQQHSVAVYASISTDTPAEMAKRTAANPGHKVIQPKLGTGIGADDLGRVLAVLGAAGPDQTVLADFNGAYAPQDFLQTFSDLRDPRLIWEDPCLSHDDNEIVAASLDVPVMFDMCMAEGPEAYTRAISAKLASSVVIKPALLGGLSVAHTVIDQCRDAGLAFRLDGPWSGPIAALAALHLARTCPPDLMICAGHLSQPFRLPNDPITAQRPGYVSLPGGAGLGVAFEALFAGNETA